MKQANYIALILFVASSLTLTMDTKHPSFVQALTTYAYDNVVTGMASCMLGKKRLYEALPQEDAQQLFARYEVALGKERKDLAEDKKIRAIATKASLEDLAIFNIQSNSKAMRESAYTGFSVTQFSEGKIKHAIGIPEELIEKIKDQKLKTSLVQGIVAREIVRITHAFTRHDERVQQLKITGGAFGYLCCCLAAGLFEPKTLIGSLPLIPVGLATIINRHDLDNEIRCDVKAAELAGSHEQLMATLKHDTSFKDSIELAFERAQKALKEGKNLPGNDARAVRMLHLLRWAKDQEEKEK